MANYQLLKVGSDAEVFLCDTATKEMVPVCGRVGGTKENPKPVSLGDGFAVQEDNVMLEFNIPPASSAQEFQHSIQIMMDFLQQEMSKQGLSIIPASGADFPKAELDKYEQANKFGCEPDFCVWLRSVNESPSRSSLTNPKTKQEYRAAGFHIHVSYLCDGREPDIADMERFVKAQDLFIGVPLSMLDYEGCRRRRYYGAEGCFRPKPYGHEYRVLGSGLLSMPQVWPWIFTQTQKAISFINLGDHAEKKLNQYFQYIHAALRQASPDHVRLLMAEFPEVGGVFTLKPQA